MIEIGSDLDQKLSKYTHTSFFFLPSHVCLWLANIQQGMTSVLCQLCDIDIGNHANSIYGKYSLCKAGNVSPTNLTVQDQRALYNDTHALLLK